MPSVIGVAVGSVAAAFAPAALFKLAFVLIAGIIAAKLLFAGDRWALGSELPGRAGMAGYGFFVGLASSLDGDQRRLAGHDDTDALRQADP